MLSDCCGAEAWYESDICSDCMEHSDLTKKNKIMILLVDADSLVWSSCFKKEKQEDSPYFDNIEDATAKLDEVFMSIVNKIEAIYPVDDYLLFNNSKGNFRTKISKTYKANRKNQPRPELLGQVHNFVTEQYGGIAEAGVETDDVVAKYWFNMTQSTRMK